MKDPSKKGYLERTIERNRRGVALAMGLAALYGVLEGGRAVASSSHEKGSDKIYFARPFDTEWTISQRAYPNSDPRSEIEKLDSQLPHDKAHANHTIHPGDRFVLSSDSKIGTPITGEK